MGGCALNDCTQLNATERDCTWLNATQRVERDCTLVHARSVSVQPPLRIPPSTHPGTGWACLFEVLNGE